MRVDKNGLIIDDNPSDFDKALKDYYNKFNCNYPMIESGLTKEEAIADIEQCIKNNKEKKINFEDVLY